MTDLERQKKFSERLLQQDHSPSETQWKEYRMQLEQKLSTAACHERRMRWVAIGAWLVAILLPLGLVVLDRIQRGMSPLPPIRLGLPLEVHAVPGAFGNVVGVVYMATIFFAWIFVLVYLFRSRPALQRTRDEYQAALFADLQRQIAELMGQTPRRE
jgi:hypothetical protein